MRWLHAQRLSDASMLMRENVSIWHKADTLNALTTVRFWG